ncbi:MAG: hypothetical protein ACI9PD_001887, partial [Psychrobacter glaciei]
MNNTVYRQINIKKTASITPRHYQLPCLMCAWHFRALEKLIPAVWY